MTTSINQKKIITKDQPCIKHVLLLKCLSQIITE